MRWLYQMQQRIAITRSESNLLLGLVLLAGLGLVARHVQSQPQPLPERIYAEEQIAFQHAATVPVVEAGLTELPVSATEQAATEQASASKPASRPKAAPAPGSINLNAATPAQLQRLPRIGPKLAERIIAYREEHGPFQRVQDLVRVRGIGKKTFAQMEPYLSLD